MLFGTETNACTTWTTAKVKNTYTSHTTYTTYLAPQRRQRPAVASSNLAPLLLGPLNAKQSLRRLQQQFWGLSQFIKHSFSFETSQLTTSERGGRIKDLSLVQELQEDTSCALGTSLYKEAAHQPLPLLVSTLRGCCSVCVCVCDTHVLYIRFSNYINFGWSVFALSGRYRSKATTLVPRWAVGICLSQLGVTRVSAQDKEE